MDPTHRPDVLVTGASRGLGAVIAEYLAADGFTVFAGMRRPTPQRDPALHPVALDVTDPASVAAAATAVGERLGRHGLAAVVNNAAVLEAGPLELADATQIDRHLRTNITGPLTTVQAFLPLLRRNHGRIINISSINAQLPMPYWGLYSASKAALVALSDAMRIELAPSGIGVTVLTLGAFATDIRRRALHNWPASDAYPGAKATSQALVEMLDATAADPRSVAQAVKAALDAEVAPAHLAVGNGIDDLLALASQPAHIRDAALSQLLTAATDQTPITP
jgi:NAD(P)-dependent dehydrogenase (short-subunit alcohol dehydrogenase family)